MFNTRVATSRDPARRGHGRLLFVLLVLATAAVVTRPGEANAEKGVLYEQCMQDLNEWYSGCLESATWIQRASCAATYAIREWRCKELLAYDRAIEAILPFL